MREMFDCELNGIAFSQLYPSLYIEDIEEQIKTRTVTAQRPFSGLTLVNDISRDSLDINIRFMIKERDRAKRQSLVSEINSMCMNGGWLKTSTRSDKRIYAVCSKPADVKSLVWSDSMTLTMTAYDCPYWQDLYPTYKVFTGTTGTADFLPLGTRQCYLEGQFKNVSGSVMNTLTLSANGYTISLSGLSIANGKTLFMYYDPRHVLRFEVDGVSKLYCMSNDSSDDILLNPRKKNVVTFTTDKKCEFQLMVRGLYE